MNTGAVHDASARDSDEADRHGYASGEFSHGCVTLSEFWSDSATVTMWKGCVQHRVFFPADNVAQEQHM